MSDYNPCACWSDEELADTILFNKHRVSKVQRELDKLVGEGAKLAAEKTRREANLAREGLT